MEVVLHILLTAIGAYLAFNAVYLLFFSLAGHLNFAPATQGLPKKWRSVCVLIPAYKEDNVILETAHAALAHEYGGNFQVFVIADKLQPSTLQKLRDASVGVIEVHFEKSTKGKSLKLAMETLTPRGFDIAVVLDADNIMDTGFLSHVNQAFDKGYRVVQGHRTAKNMHTPFALLDACNEEINNHIFRRGHRAVGLSSALIGSGMAFDFSYLNKLLADIGETAGEDKEIDIRILRDKVTIQYLHRAVVLDEKVSDAKVFTSQRTRWIATQVDFVKNHVAASLYQLVARGNLAFFDKMVQSVLLPRILLMGVLSFFAAVCWLLPWGPSPRFWLGLLLTAGAALLVALPGKFYNRQLWAALTRLPLALLSMSIALIRSRKAGNTFIHTPHTSNVKL